MVDAAAHRSRRGVPRDGDARDLRPRREHLHPRPEYGARAADAAAHDRADRVPAAPASRRSGAGWSRCRSVSTSRTGSRIPDFDIEYHVRELALPAPGDDQQLAEQAARLHARHLDRRRPLWELYLIHGLQGGRVGDLHEGPPRRDRRRVRQRHPRRVARPVARRTAARGRRRRGSATPSPAPLEMLARSAVSLAGHPVRAARLTVSVTPVDARAWPGARPRPAAADHRPAVPPRTRPRCCPSPGLRAPATPFNKPIGPHRRWAFRSVPFADVKAVKNASGRDGQRRGHGAVRRRAAPLAARPRRAAGRAAGRRGAGVGTDRGAEGHRRQPGVEHHRADADQPRRPGGAARGVARGDARGQGAARRAAGRPAGGRHPVRDARAGRSGRAAVGAAAADRADQPVQPHHLERARPQRPAVLRREPAARLLPAVRDRRRPGAQHHGDELRRAAALRADRRSRPGARPRPDGRLHRRGARRPDRGRRRRSRDRPDRRSPPTRKPSKRAVKPAAS